MLKEGIKLIKHNKHKHAIITSMIFIIDFFIYAPSDYVLLIISRFRPSSEEFLPFQLYSYSLSFTI